MSDLPEMIQITSVQDLVSFVTLLSLFLGGLWRLSQFRTNSRAQNREVLPVLSLEYIEQHEGWGAHVLIKNTGRGHAYNITLPPYEMWLTDDWITKKMQRFVLYLKSVPDDLAAGKERRLAARAFEGKARSDADFMTTVIVGHERLRVPICYSDVDGRRYVTYVETGSGMAKIIRPARRFGAVEWVKYRIRYSVATSIKRRYFAIRAYFVNRRADNIAPQ